MRPDHLVPRDRARSTLPRKGFHSSGVPLGWLPLAWVAVLFASNVKFSARDTREALQGVLSVSNLLEVGIYVLIGSACASTWIRFKMRPPGSWGLRLLFIFGALAVYSTVWSTVPIFSLVRGSQIVVIAMLSFVSYGVWSRGIRSGARDWRRIWLATISVALGFSILGILSGGVGGGVRGRFIWPGNAAVETGEFLAVMVVVVMSMLLDKGWGLRGRTRHLLVFALAVFLGLMVVNVTRTAMIAAVIASGVVYLTRATRRHDLRWLVVPALGLAATTLWYWFSDALTGFVMRGEPAVQLSNLNGRTLLWAKAWDLISEHWLIGYGYGSGRGLFLDEFSFGGHAHNLWVEGSVDLGVVGFALISAIAVWTLWRAFVVQRVQPGPVGNLGVGLVTVAVIAGVGGPSFAFPGLFLSTLGITIAAVASVTSRHHEVAHE